MEAEVEQGEAEGDAGDQDEGRGPEGQSEIGFDGGEVISKMIRPKGEVM